MYLIFPKIGRSGHARSWVPNTQATPAREFGSRPSRNHRLFSARAARKPSSGVALHSRIFFPQYMRRWLWRNPVRRIARMAAFQYGSCVRAASRSAIV